jgi:ABC-type uncharacterized transport system substrate-binding protein
VGVILQGDPWYSVVDGFREGLHRSGLVEGTSFVLDVRDTGGDLKAAEDAARNLEQQKADVIYTAATSVSLAAKRATTTTPIVFLPEPILSPSDSSTRSRGQETG